MTESSGQQRRRLERGPWCWARRPADRTEQLALVPTGPPMLRPGQVPLVTASGDRTAIWSLRSPAAPSDLTPFGAAATAAWRNALQALPLCVPLLWRLPTDLDPMPQGAYALVTNHPPDRDLHLDGASFGLSFLLALASQASETPIVADMAASGEVTADGVVLAVDGVIEKLHAIARDAPSIRRVLLPTRSVTSKVRQAARTLQLALVPVEHGSAAIKAALGRAIDGSLVDLGQDGKRRQSVSRQLFDLTVDSSTKLSHWPPVQAAAALARKHWKQASPKERAALEFATMTAARHHGEIGPAPLPPLDWFHELGAERKLAVAAHYLQQCADTGEPEVAATLDFAKPFLEWKGAAQTAQLRVQGAHARLLALRGEAAEALRLQEDAARRHEQNGQYGEVSYSLSEWYRLAGLLEDPSAFDRAEEYARDVERAAHRAVRQDPFVQLSRARALVWLSGSLEEATTTLRTLAEADASAVASHVRNSARRWLAAVQRSQGFAAEADQTIAALTAAARKRNSESRRAATYLALARLDLALGQQQPSKARRAVVRLSELRPGIVDHLRATRPADLPRYVARNFPY